MAKGRASTRTHASVRSFPLRPFPERLEAEGSLAPILYAERLARLRRSQASQKCEYLLSVSKTEFE